MQKIETMKTMHTFLVSTTLLRCNLLLLRSRTLIVLRPHYYSVFVCFCEYDHTCSVGWSLVCHHRILWLWRICCFSSCGWPRKVRLVLNLHFAYLIPGVYKSVNIFIGWKLSRHVVRWWSYDYLKSQQEGVNNFCNVFRNHLPHSHKLLHSYISFVLLLDSLNWLPSSVFAYLQCSKNRLLMREVSKLSWVYTGLAHLSLTQTDMGN